MSGIVPGGFALATSALERRNAVMNPDMTNVVMNESFKRVGETWCYYKNAGNARPGSRTVSEKGRDLGPHVGDRSPTLHPMGFHR